MTTNHIDTLARWWDAAEEGTAHAGDTVIRREGEDVYQVYTLDVGPIGKWGDIRILHRAPKPKPAWHDAVAVLANHRDYADGPRTVWARELDPDGHDWSDARTAMAAPHHLVNVTPLIEAKVTDEMVKRAEDWYAHSSVLNDPVEDVLGILTAALGLETA